MSILSSLSFNGLTLGGACSAGFRTVLLVGSVDCIARHGPKLKLIADNVKSGTSNSSRRHFTNPSLLFGVLGGCAQIILNGMQSKHYRDWYVSAPDSVIVLVGLTFKASLMVQKMCNKISHPTSGDNSLRARIFQFVNEDKYPEIVKLICLASTVFLMSISYPLSLTFGLKVPDQIESDHPKCHIDPFERADSCSIKV